MKIFEGKNVPIKSWCNIPEQGAIEQAQNLASLPFIFKQVCLMPDTHQGYGMPIGGVIATKGVVIPNAVGVDIGCGMIAVRTSVKSDDMTVEKIKKIFGGSKEYKGGIRSSIPVGMNHHSKKQNEELMPDITDMLDWQEWHGWNDDYNSICQKQFNSALKQLGTLGGGNHFIEIQKEEDCVMRCKRCGDSPSIYNSKVINKCVVCDNKEFYRDSNVWIMIHSGSRNLGYTVAKHYNKVAQDLCKKWYSNIPPMKGEDGLAFLPLDTEEGQNYLKEMNYCLEFALENRKLMMERVKDEFVKVFGCEFEPAINIHHNYAKIENHFGENVVVHRKGATSAKLNQFGIIPGSQGTSSYIVKGKGNTESFQSCSHGAGRKMSRKKAIKELNLEEEQKKMNDQGIVHSIRHKNNLDEASGAYKDIDVVMEEQKDLVDIIVKLQPLAVVKG